MLVSGIKIDIFLSSAAAKKGVKTIIEQKGSSLDIGAFSVQLIRLDSMEYLDLTIVKKIIKAEPALCSISGHTFSMEYVLKALVPKKLSAHNHL